MADIGTEKLHDGTTLPLPPVILGELGTDPKKKTLCVYGHLDVQPASKDDGWDTEPFVLVEKNGKLYGRGATDDKGPVLGWLHIIQAYHKLGIELPVNFKVIMNLIFMFLSIFILVSFSFFIFLITTSKCLELTQQFCANSFD